MENIDKWLKSLRLHKYTHLFQSLTYEQMLNLEEKYLIDRDVTKGARNKMIVSVKKLNLRRERLVNMIDDLTQDNISMKEALTVLKDMLITPIPVARRACSTTSSNSSSPSSSTCLSSSNSLISASSSLASSTSPPLLYSSSTSTPVTMTIDKTTPIEMISPDSAAALTNLSPCSSLGSASTANSTTTTAQVAKANKGTNNTNNNNNNSITSDSNKYLDPYELTYLFIETLEKVAQLLIESAGLEDNACHGIMAAIVEECLKHNSFTKEQKAKVAGFKQHFTKEQKAKVASFKQQQQLRHHHQQQLLLQQQQQQQQQHQQQQQLRHHQQRLQQQQHQQHQLLLQQQQQQHQQHQYQHQQQQQQQLKPQHSYNHHHYSTSTHQNQVQFHNNHHYHYHHHHNHWNGPIQPPSLSTSSLSTIGSASTSDEEERQTYGEYSLLGPAMTFELPCLRAYAAAGKGNRRSSVLHGKS